MATRRFKSFGALADHFDNVANALEAEKPATLAEIGESVAERAKSKIGHYQPGWPPLAATTLEGWRGFPGKIELGYSPPDNPLLRTGEMRDSIGFSVTGVSSVTVGARDPKAVFHELGTSKMPARPFIGPSMLETRETTMGILRRIITRAFRI